MRTFQRELRRLAFGQQQLQVSARAAAAARGRVGLEGVERLGLSPVCVVSLDWPQFQVHHLSLDDDPSLAVAFSAARRSAVIPTLTAAWLPCRASVGVSQRMRREGHTTRGPHSSRWLRPRPLCQAGVFDAQPRTYLDSVALQQQLQELQASDPHLRPVGAEAPDAGGSASGSAGQQSKRTPVRRTIPVFIFSLDSEYPVFIDQYFAARAASNMVLVARVMCRCLVLGASATRRALRQGGPLAALA